MRRRPTLSPGDSADVEEIYQYSRERFGAEQARRYPSGLREAFEHLASHPSSGRKIAAGSEVRCWLHRAQYRILFREHGDRLEIGRLIHAARETEYQRALQAYHLRTPKHTTR